MKNLLIAACAIFIGTCNIYSQSPADTIDPLYRSRTLGKNAEMLILLNKAGLGQNRYIYDYNGSTSEVSRKFYDGTSNSTGTVDVVLYGDMAVATGDFNGDNADDVVTAWECANNAIYLSIPKINQENFSWTENNDTLISGVLKHVPISYNEPLLKTLRLASGYFSFSEKKSFVLSYFGVDNKMHIKLFETDSLFRIKELAEAVDTLLRPYSFDITVGDFDGDGLDEIAYLNPYLTKHSIKSKNLINSVNLDIYSKFKVFKFQPGVKRLSNNLNVEIIDKSNFSFESLFFNPSEFSIKLNSLSMSAGKTEPEGADRVFYGLAYSYSYVGSSSYESKNDSHIGINTLSVEGLKGIGNHAPNITIVPQNTASSSRFYLKCADLNGDMVDEIVCSTMSSLNGFELDSDLSFKSLFSIKLKNPYDGSGYYFRSDLLAIADLDADTSSAQKWFFPEIVLLADENGNSYYEFNIYKPVIDFSTNAHKITGITPHRCLEQFTVKTSNYSGFYVALGDFDGDGIYLEKPAHHAKRSVILPTVVLNAPPTHFDILKDKGTLDLNKIYPVDAKNKRFSAFYKNTQSSSYRTSTELRQGLGESASVGYKYGFFSSNFKAKFENISERKNESASTVLLSSGTESFADDHVYGLNVDYHLFEYPVIYKKKKIGKYLVTCPVYARKNNWYVARNLNPGIYWPEHEIENLLSYPDYETLDDIPDIMLDDQLNKQGYSSGGVEVNGKSAYTWTFVKSQSAGSTMSKFQDFKLSYGAQLKAFGWTAGISGDYSKSKMTSHKTIITDSLKIDCKFDEIDASKGDLGYIITPFVYWSSSGSLVLDYGVKLTGADWAKNYGKPDPAFIMSNKYDQIKTGADPGSKRLLTSDIVYYPFDAMPGDTITVFATVRNFSLVNTDKAVKVKFYLGDPDIAGSTLIKSVEYGEGPVDFGPIAARKYKSLSFTWKTPKVIPVDKSWLFAVIDTSKNEIHHDNNKAFIRLFTDKFPGNGEWKDRTDDLTGTPEFLLFNKLEIYYYPNPVKDKATIMFNQDKNKDIVFSLYNFLGQKLQEKLLDNCNSGWNTFPLDVSGYKPGLYYFTLRSNDFKITRKIMVE